MYTRAQDSIPKLIEIITFFGFSKQLNFILKVACEGAVLISFLRPFQIPRTKEVVLPFRGCSYWKLRSVLVLHKALLQDSDLL